MSVKEHQRRVLARAVDTLQGTWRLYAACKTHVPGRWTPHKDDFHTEDLSEQRQVASFCHLHCLPEVRMACLEFALDTGEHDGVWGGTTEAERAHLFKGKAKKA